MAIVDMIFLWCFLFDCSFFTACPRVAILTAPQTGGVFPFCNDYRAFRTVQAALQTATAVVSSRELVSFGNGELYAVVEWVPTAMLVQFAR